MIDWKVGGISINDKEDFSEAYGDLNPLTSNKERNLSFNASENIGTYYDISVNLQKYWSEDEVNIMLNTWDIAPSPLESERSVTLVTVERPMADIINSDTKPTQLLAAIGTHLPHYLMYNLRLVLTVLVMFFASFWLYALIQKVTSYEEEI